MLTKKGMRLSINLFIRSCMGWIPLRWRTACGGAGQGGGRSGGRRLRWQMWIISLRPNCCKLLRWRSRCVVRFGSVKIGHHCRWCTMYQEWFYSIISAFLPAPVVEWCWVRKTSQGMQVWDLGGWSCWSWCTQVFHPRQHALYNRCVAG